jgi:hypothetical protein
MVSKALYVVPETDRPKDSTNSWTVHGLVSQSCRAGRLLARYGGAQRSFEGRLGPLGIFS